MSKVAGGFMIDNIDDLVQKYESANEFGRAEDFLRNAIYHLERNASRRDQPDGERSLPRAIAAFNALEGTCLTAAQAARFMVMVKMARATGGGEYNADDYVDGAAYIAMAGEEARNASIV